jgi:hypothetical protein
VNRFPDPTILDHPIGAIEPVERGFDWPGFLIIGIPVLLAVFL